ncbi:A-kinase anchoring protein pkaap [Anticarsia gemmatalis]|uniref:A-kinase anchoring protein pkaap n=1 Tax=Anticarsia gemmatalis TaxID=129554 RepID=UPI003F76C148
MMKFWKSAAKGKSGCPVRPPEVKSGARPEIKCLINTQLLLEDNEDIKQMFEKTSKLSLSLDDILKDMKTVKYLLQFMESIGKEVLIKCWLEIEDFKKILSNSNSEYSNYSKICRTQSLDLHCKCLVKQDHKDMRSQRFSWKEHSDICTSTSNSIHKECSASSCVNLAEHKTQHSSLTSEGTQYSNHTEKAVKIFKQYVALEAPSKLDLPDNYRKSVISNICQPEGQIKEDCFKPVQDIILSQIENNHYNDFKNSPFYIKAQIDILTSGSLNLKDILHNETILFYFTEFVEQESCRVLLEFLMAVMHFRDNLINANMTSPDQAQADAIVIYDKYFSLQATNPVGFPTDIRLKIESDICTEEGPLPTCFDLPYQIVFKTLSQYVKIFLDSELYFKYLSEMIHSVDNVWSSNYKSHSDCSSEFSISTQNTLLAMGDPVFRKKKRNLSVPDMTIDSNQLYNADALWQRNRQEGLSLGRVNSLGRFESKFEPDPDKKDKSVLKKMVSRFVPTNTSKVEEEMAWQIAHMIVKDVTDLTMAPPENDHDDM